MESKKLNLTLKIWRQKNSNSAGSFIDYKVQVSPDASFLEMLDELNNDLEQKGEEAVHFESDCREGICGTCGLVINGRPHGPLSKIATCQLHMRNFKDGETLWVEPFRAKCNIRNITERKKAEEQLRETRDYLENLINYANAPIIVWDKDFKIVRFNHAFEHLTGYTSQMMIGKKLDILFPPESKNESLQKIQKTLSGEYWISVEIPILCKDKDIRIALWNSANIYDNTRKTLIATIAPGTDITERKKAEELLKEKETRLRHAQEIAHLGNWELDIINNHISWSD